MGNKLGIVFKVMHRGVEKMDKGVDEMKTEHFYEDQIEDAAKLIQQGETVAFPTDTVYGLGADARKEEAVQKIFAAKGRPADRAVTILLADKTTMNQYAKDIPKEAFLLADRFWPGPLTLVLKSKGNLAPAVTAGLDTLGMRMPADSLALKFIEACGFPLATPSANLSGRPSPTTAEHVLADLKGRIAGVIDGGETDSGIESTVLDLSNPEKAVILRPGGVGKQEIEDVIGKKVFKKVKKLVDSKQDKHYEPMIPIYLVQSDWIEAFEKMKNEKIALLASEEIVEQYGQLATAHYSLGERSALSQAQKSFFKAIRKLERSEATVILAELYPENEASEAYLNRLKKAATGKVI